MTYFSFSAVQFGTCDLFALHEEGADCVTSSAVPKLVPVCNVCSYARSPHPPKPTTFCLTYPPPLGPMPSLWAMHTTQHRAQEECRPLTAVLCGPCLAGYVCRRHSHTVTTSSPPCATRSYNPSNPVHPLGPHGPWPESCEGKPGTL